MRRDVLVYTTTPLSKAVNVTGPVSIKLFVSSNVKDTDFTAKLVDVFPDGRAFNLDDSIQRARYRQGYDREVFMKRDEAYEIDIGPLGTSNVFAQGHRIRVEISSSNFPHYSRNLNTGGRNWDELRGVSARNLIRHSRQFPSQIVLPIVPN